MNRRRRHLATLSATVLLLASEARTETATPGLSASTGAVFAKDVTISTAPGARLGNVTNTAEATVAFWLRGTRANGGPGGADDINNGSAATATLNNFAIFANNRNTRCEASNGAPGKPADGWCLAPLDNSAPGGQYSFNDSDGEGPAHGINLATANAKAAFANGRWNFLIATYKRGHCALYNGVTPIGTCPGNISSTIVNDLASAKGAYIWNAVSGLSNFGYLQDFYLSQSYIGCTGRGAPHPDCKGDNTIAPSVLARFIRDGKPVEFGPTCAGPSGAQPAICLTGDAAAMRINKGYATGLALRGPGGAPLPPGASLDDSPYGATGIRERQVTLKNLFFHAAPYQTKCDTPSSETAGGCGFAGRSGGPSIAPNSGGQALAIGDLRVLVVALSDNNASTDHRGLCPTTASGAWTKVMPTSPAWDASQWLYSYVCFVQVTSPKEEDYVPGVSWTGSAEGRAWAMLTYANVARVQAVGAAVRGPSTTLSTPRGQLPSRPSKLVSIWSSGEGVGAGRTYNYNGSGKRRLRPANWGGVVIYVVDEDVTASAPTQRDLTRNVAAHGSSVNFYLSLVPN